MAARPEPLDASIPLGADAVELLVDTGCFRVRGLVPEEAVIDTCRNAIYHRLRAAIAAKSNSVDVHNSLFGAVADEGDVQRCRWSLLLSLSPPVLSVLQSAVDRLGFFIAACAGPDAILCDLNSFVSDKGCCAQTPHFDTAYEDADDVGHRGLRLPTRLVTVFLALQDIDDDMGPTLMWQKTHNSRQHEQLRAWQEQRRYTAFGDANLFGLPVESGPPVVCMMKKGDAVIMDSRLIHAGSANAARRRSLLAFSFCPANRKIPGQTHCIIAKYRDQYSLQSFRQWADPDIAATDSWLSRASAAGGEQIETIETDSDDPLVQTVAGSLLPGNDEYAAGNYKAARRTWSLCLDTVEQAMTLYPWQSDGFRELAHVELKLRLRLAEANLALGVPSTALEHLEWARVLDSDNRDMHRLKADALQMQAQSRGSSSSFTFLLRCCRREKTLKLE